MKPGVVTAHLLWLKVKRLLAMVDGGAAAKCGRKPRLRPSRRRTRTFFEMP